MNVLFIGDIVGSQGRAIVQSLLPVYKEKYAIDLVIANGENAAHGKGITPKIVNQFLSWGIDVITLGNHAYAKREVLELSEDLPVVFPGNMEGKFSNRHTIVLHVSGIKVAISNVYGSVFMDNATGSPFDLMQEILLEHHDCAHIVDFHGEATAEKQIFMHYFKEDVSAILGTHTHVQTADEDIFSGCGYISDVGMCGAYESILGRDTQEALSKVVENQNTHYKPSNMPPMFCAVAFTINDDYKTTSIERIMVKPTESVR